MKTTLQPGEALICFRDTFQQLLASGAPKTSDSTNVSITGGTITNTDIITKAGIAGTLDLHLLLARLLPHHKLVTLSMMVL
jgi:hypothetical protein